MKRTAVILALDTSDNRKPDTEADIARHKAFPGALVLGTSDSP